MHFKCQSQTNLLSHHVGFGLDNPGHQGHQRAPKPTDEDIGHKFHHQHNLTFSSLPPFPPFPSQVCIYSTNMYWTPTVTSNCAKHWEDIHRRACPYPLGAYCLLGRDSEWPALLMCCGRAGQRQLTPTWGHLRRLQGGDGIWTGPWGVRKWEEQTSPAWKHEEEGVAGGADWSRVGEGYTFHCVMLHFSSCDFCAKD